MKGDDEMVNDEELAEEMGFEKLCASGNCISMPAKQKMQIKVSTVRPRVTLPQGARTPQIHIFFGVQDFSNYMDLLT